MSEGPNILLFFTDDQRFDTIAALGNEHIHTPHLDALCASGTTFTRAHIPGGTCGAVCMPSRAMLHTGRDLFHVIDDGRVIPNEHTLLGEQLQQAGYQAFGTGKWHNGTEAFARSFNCGGEIFFGGMGDHWNVPACDYDPSGVYDCAKPVVDDPWESNSIRMQACDHVQPGRHSSELFVDAACNFLSERDTTNPFFLYVSLMAPHDPRTMPAEFLEMYKPDDIALPDNFAEEHEIDNWALKIRDEMLAAFPRDPDEIRRHIAEYYAMISHLDHELGRLLESLRACGELENTIIVFAGDNGLAVGQHGLMGKQNLYEHSVRVPLIFSGPGIAADKRCDSLVYLLDIFPTICELLNLDHPESVEGLSLAPCLEDTDHTVRDQLYLAYENSIRGISNGHYKLIEYACGATQLFDLGADPLEISSLAESPEHADTLSIMRGTLCRMAGEQDDRNHPTGQVFWKKREELLAE